MKINAKSFYLAFISLLFLFQLNNANAAECKEIYYAKTLEGNREVKLCTIGKTLIYRFGKIGQTPELTFSTLKKNVLYTDYPIYDGPDRVKLASIYIPYGNTWYGISSLTSADAYNILTVNRGHNLNYSNFFTKVDTLMQYALDEDTIVDNLNIYEFTKIKDTEYEKDL